MNDEQHDLAAPYVLDALPDEERALYERHLETCAECRSEIMELRQVVGVLPLAPEMVDPPESLKHNLLEAVQRDEPHRPSLTALPGGAAAPGRRVPRFSGWVYASVAALLIAALGVWNIRLQQTVQDQRAALTFERSVAAQLTRGASVMRVPGTSAAPSAEAAMVQPAHGGNAYFIVAGLPQTPGGKVYQLWFVRGKTPRSAAVFRYQGSDAEIVRLPMRASGYQLAAVTVEPGPHGSRLPTGPKVILGALRAA